MKFSQFYRIMEHRNLTPKEKANLATAAELEYQNERIAELEKMIRYLREHISELYKIIYELAPEYEIIETMADSDEERRAMCDAYMNHGDYCNAAAATEHEKR